MTSENEQVTVKTKLKNSVSGSGRMLLVIGGVSMFAVVAGLFAINSLTGTKMPASAQMQEAPASSDAPTGEDADPVYQAMIEERSRLREQQALESGTSSVATLTSGRSVDLLDENACVGDCIDDREALRLRLAQLEEQEAGLKADLERARALAAQQSAQPVEPNRFYFEYKDHIFMTPEYSENQIAQMRSELQRVASAHRPVGASQFVASGYTPEITRVGDSIGDGESTVSVDSERDGYLISAGDVGYATLDLEANSDVPGPVRATVHGGEWSGSRMLGSFAVSNDYLVMRFNLMVTPSGEHLPIQAVAIDPETRLAGVVDRVDRHYLQRFGALMGAAFLQGYGNAVLASREIRREAANSDREEVVSNIESDGDRALAALGAVGDEIAAVVRPLASRPPTVIKYADQGIGVLFLAPVEVN